MMKMRYGIALMALAVVGFLALPALAMPSEKGCADAPHYGMHFMLDNVTTEQLNNMTLAEIRELRQKQMEKLDNMTLAEIRELHQKNATPCQVNDTKCQAPMGQGARRSGSGQMGGRQYFGQGMDGIGMMPPMMGLGHVMLMDDLDDLTEEELNNMTIAEIRKLRQKKMQELENMTLGQIKELQHKKMQERMDKLNNTTLGELMKQGKGFFAVFRNDMGQGQPMGSDDMAGHAEMRSAGMGW